MMWQTLMAVVLVWLAVSVGTGVLVGRLLRRSSDAVEFFSPQLPTELPSNPRVVRAG